MHIRKLTRLNSYEYRNDITVKRKSNEISLKNKAEISEPEIFEIYVI